MSETDQKSAAKAKLSPKNRAWIARRVALVAIISVLISGGLAYLTYWIVGWENYNTPVPLLMPVLMPLLLTPVISLVLLNYIATIKEQKEKLTDLSDVLAKAKDEAIAANEAKSAYMAMISHEIRTPLGGMRGLIELIQTDPSSDRSRDFLTMLLNTSDALLDLLTTILDSAKIEAGKLDLNETEISLHDFLGQLAQLWQHTLSGKSVEFILDKPDRDYVIVADDFRCRQILNNFLSNAAKFTEEGSVKLGADIEEKGTRNARLHLYVQDTGAGMTKEQIPLLFKEFEQTDKSVSALHGGSGLGLNISRKLAELMGGEIHVESEVGRGSRFTLEFDVTLATPAIAASA